MNTAARLQSAAAPGTVLVAASTQRLVERAFVWSEPRSLGLKGKAEPVVEQNLLVPRRLERFGAGRRMGYDDATPEVLDSGDRGRRSGPGGPARGRLATRGSRRSARAAAMVAELL